MDQVDPRRLICLTFGALETLSIIIRARNAGRLPADAADDAIANCCLEVLSGVRPLIHPEETLLWGAAEMVERHDINSTDALVLRIGLDLRSRLQHSGEDIVLVAADHRLVRAANRELLPVFNPEDEDLAALEALAR